MVVVLSEPYFTRLVKVGWIMDVKINKSVISDRKVSRFSKSCFDIKENNFSYATGELRKIGEGAAKLVEYHLSELEKSQILKLMNEVSNDISNSSPYRMANYASIYSGELPRGIREVAAWFKQTEPAMALVIKNNPVYESKLPDTPNSRVEMEDCYKINGAQQLHAIYGSLLGQQISFSSQFNGSLFTNIIPMRNFESVANASSGFRHDFGFHVEDAFHPYMPDYLGLICLRNFEKAKTILTTIGPDDLEDHEYEILSRARYKITNNALHTDRRSIDTKLYQVLFGNPDKPYIRINTCDIDYEGLSEEECIAIDKLVEKLERNYLEVILQTGDCIYVDNFRALHGRASYSPNFGNKARWLTRITLASDLRKSSDLRRDTISHRIISA